MILGSSASLTVEELDGYFASNAVVANGNIWCGMLADSTYSNGIAIIDSSTGSLSSYRQVGLAGAPSLNRISTNGTHVFLVQQGDDIRKFSATNPSTTAEIVGVSYTTVDATYNDGFLWVAENSPTPQILKIETDGFTISETFTFEGYTSFQAIFHDGTYLWAASATEREILRINADNGSVIDTCSMGSAPDVFTVTAGSIIVDNGYLVATYRNAELDGTLLVAPVDNLAAPSLLSAPTLINDISPLGDYWWASFDQAELVNNEIVLSFRHYFYPGGEDDGNAGGIVSFDPATETITSSILVNDGYNEFNGTIFGLSGIGSSVWYHHFSFNPPTNILYEIEAVSPPVVTGLSPISGLTPGGNSVAVSGSGFTTATSVFFGAESASFTIQSDSLISATAPPGTAGQVDVTVEAPSGISATSSASKYTYVTTIATGGTSITISSGGGAASGAPLTTSRNEAEEKNLTGPLEHPFRFINGKIPKVVEGSDHFSAQRIASAASIGFNELPLRPIFGSNSPEFVGFDRGGFMLTCGSYFPDIRIVEAEEFIGNDGKGKIEIKFARNE